MATLDPRKNKRILIIDDNEDIQKDFRDILNPRNTADLDEVEASFFGRARAPDPSLSFELTSAYQGVDALKEIRRSLKEGTPYALAFVDMRMPPGWDGLETLCRIWNEDQALQAVICSAYSDISWDDVAARFGHTDRLLILKKPFDAIEVRQLACALTEKWNQHHDAAQATRRMAVQYAVTQTLVESTTLAEAGPKLLRVIGEALGWPFGALWLPDEMDTRELRPACTFNARPADLAEIEAATARGALAAGEGAVGRAFASGELGWTTTAGEGCARGEAAARAGLHAVLHVPIKRGDLVLGVLELFDTSRREPARELLDAMREICLRIGQFVHNKRVESALQRSEADNRGLLHALPDTILRVSRDGSCLDYKAASDPSPSSSEPRLPVKRSLDELLPAHLAERLLEQVERALADSATHVFEYAEPTDGGVRELEARIAAIGASDAVVVIRDVTESRRARAEAEQKRAQEDTIRAQAEALMKLSTPLIPITDDIVVIPLVGALDASRMRQIQATVVHGISAHRTRVAILDITGVTELDAQVAEELMRVAQAARMLGTKLIMTGMRPDVAKMLVGLGHDLTALSTHRTLQSGVSSAMRSL